MENTESANAGNAPPTQYPVIDSLCLELKSSALAKPSKSLGISGKSGSQVRSRRLSNHQITESSIRAGRAQTGRNIYVE